MAKQRLRNTRGRHPGIQGNRRNLQAVADALYTDYDNADDNHEDEINEQNERNNNNIEGLENNNDSGEYSTDNDNL